MLPGRGVPVCFRIGTLSNCPGTETRWSIARRADVLLKEATGGWVEACDGLILFTGGGELSADVEGEFLAKLDAPLIEGVDVVEEALDGSAVFVKGDELAGGVGSQGVEQEDV